MEILYSKYVNIENKYGYLIDFFFKFLMKYMLITISQIISMILIYGICHILPIIKLIEQLVK